ncbi:MAG: hypothetical protein FWF09_03980 [Bacteroidales bacterium]|nr:hypothetical protein [Bacteroidales bacterium]
MEHQPDKNSPLPSNDNRISYIHDKEWLAIDHAILKMERAQEKLKELKIENDKL